MSISQDLTKQAKKVIFSSEKNKNPSKDAFNNSKIKKEYVQKKLRRL